MRKDAFLIYNASCSIDIPVIKLSLGWFCYNPC